MSDLNSMAEPTVHARILGALERLECGEFLPRCGPLTLKVLEGDYWLVPPGVGEKGAERVTGGGGRERPFTRLAVEAWIVQQGLVAVMYTFYMVNLRHFTNTKQHWISLTVREHHAEFGDHFKLTEGKDLAEAVANALERLFVELPMWARGKTEDED